MNYTAGPLIAKEGMIYSESGPSGKTMAFCKDEANANFIVRACNSHDELLEACKVALGFWQIFHDMYIPDDKEEADFRSYGETMKNKLSAAIAKAE